MGIFGHIKTTFVVAACAALLPLRSSLASEQTTNATATTVSMDQIQLVDEAVGANQELAADADKNAADAESEEAGGHGGGGGGHGGGGGGHGGGGGFGGGGHGGGGNHGGGNHGGGNHGGGNHGGGNHGGGNHGGGNHGGGNHGGGNHGGGNHGGGNHGGGNHGGGNHGGGNHGGGNHGGGNHGGGNHGGGNHGGGNHGGGNHGGGNHGGGNHGGGNHGGGNHGGGVYAPPSCALQADSTEVTAGTPITFTLTANGEASAAWIDQTPVAIPGSVVETPTTAGSFVAQGEVSGPGGVSYCSLDYEVTSFVVGESVETTEAADLYGGSTVVGSVPADAYYTISQIQGSWVLLTDSNGNTLAGWISMSYLEPANH